MDTGEDYSALIESRKDPDFKEKATQAMGGDLSGWELVPWD